MGVMLTWTETWLAGNFEDIIKIDPVKKIKNFENPVRIIHGSNDNDILPINSIAYESVLKM